MALVFEKTEAVKFGDIVAEPAMTTEQRLRVQKLPMKTVEDVLSSIDVLSSCFGEKQAEVKEFMERHMNTVQLQRLQVYLVGGEDILDKLDSKVDSLMDKVGDEKKD